MTVSHNGSGRTATSTSLGPFAQISLEAVADLIHLDIEPACDTQQGAESRVNGAALQLADSVELGADPLCQPLLSQAGLAAQFLDRLPKGGVIGRTRFRSAAGRHASRQPFRQRETLLDVITAKALLEESTAEMCCPQQRRPLRYLYIAATVPLVRIASISQVHIEKGSGDG